MSTRIVTRFVQHAMAQAEREGRSAVCDYCNRVVTLDVDASAHSRATADHRTPRARGGQHRWSNLALACAYCNHVKGPLTAGEFLAVRTNQRELRLAVSEWTRRLQVDGTPLVGVYASRADRRKAKIERRMQRLAPRVRTPDPDCRRCGGTGRIRENARVERFCQCTLAPLTADELAGHINGRISA